MVLYVISISSILLTSSRYTTAISGGCGSDLFSKNKIKFITRKTLTKRASLLFDQKKGALKAMLSEATHLCTSADCWTGRGKSFLGSTVSWIDPPTLIRKKACLSLKRLKGSHTHQVLAKAMYNVHKDFGIVDRVECSVTDNASNFGKAFLVFGDLAKKNADGKLLADIEAIRSRYRPRLEESDEEVVPDDEDEDMDVSALPDVQTSRRGMSQRDIASMGAIEVVGNDENMDEREVAAPNLVVSDGYRPVDIQEVMTGALSPPPGQDDLEEEYARLGGNQVRLPTHYRCAAHTLALLATTDADRAVEAWPAQLAHFEK